MISMRAIPAVAAFFLVARLSLHAQTPPAGDWNISVNVEYKLATGEGIATNGIIVRHNGAVLIADRATLNQKTGEVEADGHVRIQQGDQTWTGGHMPYNFQTRQMISEDFRTGYAPAVAARNELSGDITHHVYNARHAMVPTDDIHDPAVKIRA